MQGISPENSRTWPLLSKIYGVLAVARFTIFPLLHSHLNASAIPCGDFLSRFKNFGSKGNQAKTQKQQKSNEIAAFPLLFCCFCVLA